MNKYAPFLLLDLVIDIDRFLFNNELNDTTRKNIKKIKLYVELLVKYISFITYLEDGNVDEKEFNEKIVLFTKDYSERLKELK